MSITVILKICIVCVYIDCQLVSYISVFILVSSISYSYRYKSTHLATVVFFCSFFIGATVSAKLALSVLFACCRLSCFYEIVFMNK